LTEIDENLSGSRIKPKRLAVFNVAPAKSMDIITAVVPAYVVLIEKYFPDDESSVKYRILSKRNE
jgi:hypothetical protein